MDMLMCSSLETHAKMEAGKNLDACRLQIISLNTVIGTFIPVRIRAMGKYGCTYCAVAGKWAHAHNEIECAASKGMGITVASTCFKSIDGT
jgi:hypothetical protein